MDDAGAVVAFWVLTVATIGGALLVVAVRNLIQAVVALVFTFLGVAGLYILLSADFVAVAQVLIYAGAISVLMIFAIMLTPRQSRDNAENVFLVPGLVIAGAVATIIALAAVGSDWSTLKESPFPTTAAALGEALLDKYVLPFEVAAVLLLAAMVGALLLAREEEQG